VIALLATLALAAEPTPLTAHAGHATTLGKGHGAIGLFRPWAIGVSDRVDVGVSGPASLVAPKLDAKWSLLRDEDGDRGHAVALTAGLGMPTIGLSFLRGTVLTSDPTQTLGVGAVGELGLVGSLRQGMTQMSLGAEVRAGGMTGTLAPVDLPFVGAMLAPLTEGPVVRFRWVTDYALSRRLVLTTDLALQVGAGGPDALARGFFLGGLSDHVALGAGWAVASETLSFGERDSWGFPLVDVQGRW